jgi:hypothetical protein
MHFICACEALIGQCEAEQRRDNKFVYEAAAAQAAVANFLGPFNEYAEPVTGGA